MKRMGLAALVTWLVVALSFSATVFAQAGAGVGSARGTVTDAQGGTIPQAQVTITNVETGYSRTESTDSNGAFGFQSLPVGRLFR